MADAFRGLTIRLGADARPLQSAISSITTAAGRAQKQLNAMNKALKFNPSNVSAMEAKLSLLSDKAHLSARALAEIRTAMKQVPAGIQEVAKSTNDIYTSAQRARAEYTHLNASIQQIHDAMIKRIQATNKGFTKNEAIDYFKDIRSEMSHSLEAKKEWDRYFREASEKTNINELFGQEKGQVKALEETYKELHKARKKAYDTHEEAKAAEGFRAMRTQEIAWISSIHEASAEAAQLRSNLLAIKPGNLREISHEAKSIENALDEVSVAVKKADAAFKAMPDSIEAAEARVLAFKAREDTLNQSIDNLKRKMREIEATEGFDKVAASTRNVWLEAQKAQREWAQWDACIEQVSGQIDHLEDKQKALDKGASDYGKKYREIGDEIDRLSDRLQRFKSERERAEKPLAEARLAKEYREADIEVQKLTSDLRALDSASEKINAWGDRFRNIRTMGYGLYSTLTPAITMAGRYAVQAAEDIDSAYRDMRKTVQGSEEDFEKLKNDAVEYSTAHVTSAQEMLSIMAIGGQLGVTVDQLGNFSKVVSDLSIATDDAFDTESIALWLGKMQNVMHIASDDLDNFADSLVRLGNSEPALESDIANITSRFGAMGTVVGMLPDEILAIATAATATGQKAESSGGSLMRILGGIEVATSGVSQAMINMANESEESAETLEAFEGAKERLSGYAEVADMTAESFANLWETDPTEAFSRVVEGLKRISDSGGSAVDAIKNLLGINNIRDIQLLLGLTQTVDKLDEMRGMSYNAFHGISDGFGDAGDAAREAEKKSQGFSGQMEILRNNAGALGDALAEGAMPFVQMLSNMFQGLTSIVRGLPPELKSVIVLLGGLLAVAGPLTVAVGAVGSAVMSFRTMARNAIGAQTLKTAEANVRNLGKASTAAGKQAASASSGFRAFRTGAENAAASGTIIERGMSKASKGMNTIKSAASKAGAALSSIKGTLGFAAVLTAVDLVIDAFAKYLDHTRKIEIASRDVFNRMGIGVQQAADVAEEGSMRVAKALNFGEIKQMRHDWVESIADSFDMLQQKATDTFSNIGLAEHYSQIIEDLMKVADATPWATLNDEQQAQLTAAVEGYNAATGESITITNAEKAALADSAGQAIETAEAFDKLTEKKKASMVKDYLNEEYAETYKKAYEGAEQQAEAEQRLATIQAERAEIEANGIDYTDDSAVQYYKTLIEAEKQLTEEVDGYREQRELLNKTLEKTEQLEVLANKAASDSGTAIDRFMVSAQGLDISAFIAKNGQSITDFASALDSLGPKAQNLDHDQIFKLAQAWDGSLKSIMPLLEQYNVGLDELQKKTIGGMEFYVTDNGSIYDMEGKLVKFNSFTIDDKTYYVDDQGTVYNETGKLDGFRTITIEDKTYMVTDDGTIYDQSGQIANFRDIQIDGKHYYVFDDGTIYENEKKLGVLNDLELIDKIFEASDNGTISIEISSIQELISWINSVPDSHTTWFDGDTSLLEAAVESARNTVRSLTSRATAYIDAAAQQAQGGLFLGTSIMRNARGGIVAIPRHASGSINGIVTRPTMTNVGLTGEAGAEAILHMRHAGGAIIPLSNRRYVRPFARAVAAEIPSGNNGNVTNIYIGDVSYSENSREGQAVLELTRVLGMEV